MAEEPKRVALIPFKMNAEKDLTFLRDGIYDMLSSRLSIPDRVQVIEREETEKAFETVTGPVNEITAQRIGEKLNADFVLFGSLTIFGSSVSIDAKMIDVSGSKPVFPFFDQSQGMDEVIPKINLFARDINEKVFGRFIPLSKRPVPSQTKQPQAQQDQPNTRIHPEKLLEKDGMVGDDRSTGESSPFIMSPERKERSPVFWKSTNYRHLINGIAIGDVNGDGKMETVVITPHDVLLYRHKNNRLGPAEKIVENETNYFIGVDAADINGNGYAEIFVTGLNPQKNSVRSFVVEYNGQAYTRIVNRSYWYYRVVEVSGAKSLLLGQKNNTVDPFSGKTYHMHWDNDEYVPGNRVKTSPRSNLMGLTLGNILKSGEDAVVSYSDSDKIQIIDRSGKEIWKGSDPFGGSTLYFSVPIANPGDIENRKYLPMRILVWDSNADGTPEVITVKNEGQISRITTQFRKFSKSHIESLDWDGLGLRPFWKTRSISGHIRDFAIADFDNDGKKELVAAVISKEGTIIATTPKSAIIAYEIGK